MKNWIALVFACFIGQAQAAATLQPKITGQIRLDHETVNTTGSVKDHSGGFTLNRARVVFDGGVDPLTYNMIVYFDRNQFSDTGWTGSNDGVNRGLVTAKIKYKLSDIFHLELGRLVVNSLSMEGYHSSVDTYSVSEIVINKMPGSASGVSLVATHADQYIEFQVVNSPGYDKTGKSGFKVENDDLTASLFWAGNLLNGMVKPIVSFVNMARRDYDVASKTTSSKYNGQIWGFGTGVNFTPSLVWEIETDYYSNAAYRQNKAVDTKSGKTTTTTYVTSLAYDILPKYLFTSGKATYDHEKYWADPTKDVVFTTKYNWVMEWRPHKDQTNFRYHGSIEKADATTKKASIPDAKKHTMTYLVGVAATI